MSRQFRDASVIRANLCSLFPGLATTPWSIKSPLDDCYKCIAWAACRTDIQWWPAAGNPDAYWPPGADYNDSVDAFIQAFGTIGYRPCEDSKFQIGYQKVAIYASSDRRVLHMARQHFFGRGWLSKCGSLEDIQHADLECIAGNPSPLLAALGRTYGAVDTVLKRSWWSALTNLCIFRCAWAAFKFWFYRKTHPSWDV